jgi:ferric-dicitrate binding protein FerR (iron transport regulator)
VRRIIPFVSAACLLPLAILAGLKLTQRNDRQIVQRPAPTRDFTTSRGQRAELRLTDGTNVILAAQSRLSIPADYDSVSRHVTLTGEAYFDVAHSPRPFTVHAGESEVRDIGTRFDVRAYTDSAGLRVLVTQGKVELHPNNEPLTAAHPLIRGQLAHLTRNGNVLVTSNVDTTAFLAWTTGELVFNGMPAPEALREISRWYDVDITLDPILRNRTLTTVLHDQSLSEVIHLVALSLDAQVTRAGNKVRLTARRSDRIE